MDLVVGKLASGMSIDEVVAEFDVTHEDVLAALNYASDLLSRERILTKPDVGIPG